MPEQIELVSRHAAAARLAVSVRTVDRLVGAGMLLAHRVGIGQRRIGVTVASIDAYLTATAQRTNQ